jgi:hypothetical protein
MFHLIVSLTVMGAVVNQDTAPLRVFGSPNAALLMNPAVIKELAASTEQIDSLRETLTRLEAERNKLLDEDFKANKIPDFGSDFEARREYIRKKFLEPSEEERRERQAKWSDMIGAKFDYGPR